MDEMAWTTGSVAGKARTLRALLARTLAEGPVGIACSGGLDSRLLAHLAALTARAEGLALPLLAHLSGPHVPKAETASAVAWAGREGLALRLVALNPLEHPAVARNGRDRCYHCKKALFTALTAALTEAFAGRRPCVCDGSNRSDRGGFRPGLRALAELGVRSPLDEAGLTKEDIRTLAVESGLERPDQAARPCLLTRFPYDTQPSLAALRMLEDMEARTEAILQSCLDEIPDFRIRATASGGWMLQLGSCPDEVAAQILRALGLRADQLVHTDHPSGYFDRQRVSGAEA
ncbi:MAG TPA: hypothetical protein IAB01_05450 [Candidatus Avidesulfovibrio excrementigallinarum]|nr:hypothetical protein [Candidatus Avidesulfovibrio excrementigallinarum]